MRIAKYLCLCAGLMALSPAHAEPIAAKDRATVAHCVSAEDEKGKLGGACVGVVADPCISQASSRDSAADDARKCAARELVVWGERLEAAIEKASASGPPAVRPALAEAQKTWLASREKLCALFNDLDPGANLGGSDYCRLQETARRDLVVERLADAVSEH